MTDSETTIAGAVAHWIEHHGAYVIAFFSVLWATTVWAFRAIIRKYDFASRDDVVAEIQRCKVEVDKRDDEIERNVHELKREIERAREINTAEHNGIRDLIIKHLDK